jgi:hypothetical protein
LLNLVTMLCLLKRDEGSALQEGFLKRIRYAMKPDEAYGLGLFDSVNHIHLFKEPTGELGWCGYVKRFKI